MKDNNIILLKNITKEYGDFVAVDNLNLYIRKGEFLTLLGPSGCGKTTTLRMIAGFEMPDNGEVLFNDENVTEVPPYKRNVNTVFQRYALFPHLNVFNNIAFGLKLKKLTSEEIAKKVKYALKVVGMTDYEDRDVTSLSGGQQQRVAIARAIVNQPEVLLLDEPLGALDLKMRKDMQLELKEMHKELGITFIYVTHDQEEALTMSDTIVVMNNGKIQQIGSPTDIYNEPKNAFVADFIGESNIIDGIMREDFSVEFDGVLTKCADSGFEKDQDVDVVIRPEDFEISEGNQDGLIYGKIISNVFKGVHNEMYVKSSSGCEFMVQDTKYFEVGRDVSLNVQPNNIHIMKKMHVENVFDCTINEHFEIEMCGGDFACNTNQLFPNAKLNDDKEPLDENGEVIDIKNKECVARISFKCVELTDSEDDGVIGGDVITILFKGDHYQYGVRMDNGEYIYVDSLDVWDDGDRVGINIKPTDIKLELVEG